MTDDTENDHDSNRRGTPGITEDSTWEPFPGCEITFPASGEEEDFDIAYSEDYDPPDWALFDDIPESWKEGRRKSDATD